VNDVAPPHDVDTGLLELAVLLAPVAVTAAQSPPAELLYLVLGDSAPSGADLADGVGYPMRVGQRLADASGRPIRLVNRAVSGERSESVLRGQIADLRAIQPELVTLTVSANDFLVPAITSAAATVDGRRETRCDTSRRLAASSQR